jgi:glycosyltransferase involved in cell wall biosynthesis
MLRQKTLSCETESEVVFHGFVDDAAILIEFFRQADLLVVPTMIAEGFPRVIDEAFSSGVPVVCTRIGGMKYIDCPQGVCFVGTGDVEGLKDVLERFVSDKSWRDQMKFVAQKKAKSYLKKSASEQHAMAMLR